MEKFLQNNNSGYRLIELSDKYLNQAANLLISEWPRSHSQRCTSLRDFTVKNEATEFSYTLPRSLILVSEVDDRVLGHVSLVSIATTRQNQIQNLPFLQSLVVDKSLRGKGLGKLLVSFCEEYIAEFDKRQENLSNPRTHCQDLYLTTKDQHAFYEKIGYTRTEPIQFFTVKNSKNNEIMNRLLKNSSMQQMNKIEEGEVRTVSSEGPVPPAVEPNSYVPKPPPPPPLFVPSLNAASSSQLIDSVVPTWYKKCILSN